MTTRQTLVTPTTTSSADTQGTHAGFWSADCSQAFMDPLISFKSSRVFAMDVLPSAQRRFVAQTMRLALSLAHFVIPLAALAPILTAQAPSTGSSWQPLFNIRGHSSALGLHTTTCQVPQKQPAHTHNFFWTHLSQHPIPVYVACHEKQQTADLKATACERLVLTQLMANVPWVPPAPAKSSCLARASASRLTGQGRLAQVVAYASDDIGWHGIIGRICTSRTFLVLQGHTVLRTNQWQA